MFPKEFIEVTVIGKAQFIGNFVYTHIAVQKTIFDQFCLIMQDILLEGFVGVLFKIAAQVGVRYAKVLTQRPGF